MPIFDKSLEIRLLVQRAHTFRCVSRPQSSHFRKTKYPGVCAPRLAEQHTASTIFSEKILIFEAQITIFGGIIHHSPANSPPFSNLTLRFGTMVPVARAHTLKNIKLKSEHVSPFKSRYSIYSSTYIHLSLLHFFCVL